MIIISDKMKKTMNDDTVKLILKFSPILDSILSNTIYTYKEVTGKTVTFTIVKSNDVSKVVMLEILIFSS